MHEVLILGVGIMVGTIGTGCAVYLGGHLVLRIYMELTQLDLLLPNTFLKHGIAAYWNNRGVNYPLSTNTKSKEVLIC